MSWLGDRLSENNSKLAFGVIIGGAVYALQNPAAFQSGGWSVWGPFVAGLISQLAHILLPATSGSSLSGVDGMSAKIFFTPDRGSMTPVTPDQTPEQG